MTMGFKIDDFFLTRALWILAKIGKNSLTQIGSGRLVDQKFIKLPAVALNTEKSGLTSH